MNPDKADGTTSWTKTASHATSLTFGAFCLLSSLPFLNIPFPTRSAAFYYRSKNAWLSSLTSGRFSPRQAGYASAVLRIAVGAGVVWEPTREVALLCNLAVVAVGTVLAWRDGRPMGPQVGMLGGMGVCLLLGRL